MLADEHGDEVRQNDIFRALASLQNAWMRYERWSSPLSLAVTRLVILNILTQSMAVVPPIPNHLTATQNPKLALKS